jgi:hypothetical protein
MSASDWIAASPPTRAKYMARNHDREEEARQDFYLHQLGDACLYIPRSPSAKFKMEEGARRFCDTLDYIHRQGWFDHTYRQEDVHYRVFEWDGSVHPAVLRDVEEIPNMDMDDVLAQLRAQIPFDKLLTDRVTLHLSEWFPLTNSIDVNIRVMLHARGCHVSAYYRMSGRGTTSVDALPHHLCTMLMSKHRLYWTLKRFQEAHTACVQCGQMTDLFRGRCIDCFRAEPNDVSVT